MAISHKIIAGDTLWGLAKQYNTTMDSIIEANKLTSDLLYIGDDLIIPGTAGVEEHFGEQDEHSETEEEHSETEEDYSQTQEPTSPTLPSINGGFSLPEGDYTRQELDDIALLARLVYAEARGEPFEGQIAVAAVLLNRLKSPSFPDTVYGAIYQPRQFEPVQNGAINNVPNSSAYQAVLEAIGGNDPTDGAIFFWNPSLVPRQSWVWTRTITKRIGNHVFAH